MVAVTPLNAGPERQRRKEEAATYVRTETA